MPKKSARRQAVDHVRMHDRHIRAWHLKAQGLLNREIGERLAGPGKKPLHERTVAKILLEAEQRFDRATLIPDIQSVKARQISQLEYVIAEALDAWRKSKQPGRSVTQHVASRVVPGQEPGAPVKGKLAVAENTSTHANEREGNPKYLEAAMGAMDRIRRMTGADAPVDVRWGMTSMYSDVSLENLDERGLGDYLGELAQAALLLNPPDPNIIDMPPVGSQDGPGHTNGHAPGTQHDLDGLASLDGLENLSNQDPDDPDETG